MLVSEFDYALPPELIAQQPAPARGASRLLHLDGASGEMRDLAFADLPGLVDDRDVLVLNDTRVIKARLRGRKSTGGRIELFVERILGEHEALALSHSGHPLKPGHQLVVGDGARVEVLGREADFVRVRFVEPVAAVLERCGEVPLPPYIRHAPGAEDAERYQTVYAARPGAVAAPTAGLHFDEALLDRLGQAGAELATVTLHVGIGTFKPVTAELVHEHRMERERFAIPPATARALRSTRERGGRVVAVGTTVVRTLEAAALLAGGEPLAGSGATDLFITPGFRFLVVDVLLTNFHLPRSTLLMLVSAFAGTETIRRAYAHAVARRYRFFSYGDAMFLENRGQI
jgi:S-adenosylmethionine:tRNA ribosyltransferase-isomerase